MTPRARYVAKSLLKRMQHLEAVAREDGLGDAHELRTRRQELVAKVLAGEAITTEWGDVVRVTAAMPRVPAAGDTTEKEIRELAEYLERTLDLG